MDLSVLKSADPAGYKAEETFRKKEREAATSIDEKQPKYKVTGSIAGADSGQFHQYRKTRREEIERLESFEHQLKEEAEDEEFYRRREVANRLLEEKREKNRAKRLKKKAKSKLQTPKDSTKI